MGKDLANIAQYELTNDIIKNHYVFDLKDGALKVLLILSTHYPNILVQRKSIINRYKVPEKTADRAFKELIGKGYINRQNDGRITLNLAVIYSQIDGEKVVNLTVPCNNQHDKTENTNKHVTEVNTGQKDCDKNVVVLLKSFGFSDIEVQRIMKDNVSESIEKYAQYVTEKHAANPKKYLLWCLKEKPLIPKNQKTVSYTHLTLPTILRV